MFLYLLRHAEAVDAAPSDAERELTPRGLEQARTVGAFCQRHGLRPDLILSSPYRRTVQTADLVAAAMEGVPVFESSFLASGMEPLPAFETLRTMLPALQAGALAATQEFQRRGVNGPPFGRMEDVMLVGHQPDLGQLAAALIGLRDGDSLPVGKAALIGLRANRFAPGGGRLEFFLPVKMMG